MITFASMNRVEVNNTIIQYLSKYNAERIGIFGSFARGENTEQSDIDILVKFKKTISLFDLVKIHRELSELLGIEVDIVTESSLKNERLKKYIYKDLKLIYQ